MENVLNIIFENQKDAYLAVKKLKELNNQNDIDLAEMYVVQKDAKGKISLKTSSGNNFRYTTGFGLIGSMAGILAGPQGMLLGAGYGMLLGMFGDLLDQDDTKEYLKMLSSKMENNKTMLVAHVWEEWTTPLNVSLEQFNCEIQRVSVEEEIEKELQEIENEFEAEFKEASEEYNNATDRQKSKAKAKLTEIKERRNKTIAEFKANTKKQSQELKELLTPEKKEESSFEKSIKSAFDALKPKSKSVKKVHHLSESDTIKVA